jgi:hypothetical protein
MLLYCYHDGAARQRSRGGASRGDVGVKSWFENGWKNNDDSRKKVIAVIFYFYFRTDGNVACWAVRTSRPTNVRPDEMDTLPIALS